MKGTKYHLAAFLKIFNVLILLTGFGSAGWIYRTTDNAATDILGYEQNGGMVNPVLPDDSKKYLHDLELYGGKTNVLMDQMRRWFIGLWQGKSLAYTLSGITIMLSLGIFYLTGRLPTESESDPRIEKTRTPSREKEW